MWAITAIQPIFENFQKKPIKFSRLSKCFFHKSLVSIPLGWGSANAVSGMNALLPSGQINYHPCRYGTSKVLFRGPPRKLRGDFVAFIGASPTFGPGLEHPFPNLVEEKTGVAAVNLGYRNAGIDFFRSSSALMDICAMSRVTIVQIMGAAHMSNRFYTVDPRHNERFVRATKRVKDIFPEVNFADFATVEDLLFGLASAAPERLHYVRQEVQTAWVARMRTLLSQIEGPKILLWLSDHVPFSNKFGGTICKDPMFVDRAMINAVTDYADAYVELSANRDEVTSPLSTANAGDIVVSPNERILSQSVHQRAANELAPILAAFTAKADNIFADDLCG